MTLPADTTIRKVQKKLLRAWNREKWERKQIPKRRGACHLVFKGEKEPRKSVGLIQIIRSLDTCRRRIEQDQSTIDGVYQAGTTIPIRKMQKESFGARNREKWERKYELMRIRRPDGAVRKLHPPSIDRSTRVKKICQRSPPYNEVLFVLSGTHRSSGPTTGTRTFDVGPCSDVTCHDLRRGFIILYRNQLTWMDDAADFSLRQRKRQSPVLSEHKAQPSPAQPSTGSRPLHDGDSNAACLPFRRTRHVSDSISYTRMEKGNGKDGSKMMIEKTNKGLVSLAASLEEGLQDAKASVTGLVKKATAKTEQEASEADLRTAKMQVEAADAAEKKKKQLQI
ncbi:hypothetical protein BHM03_00056617 [Ensete ventricosum]|nr:hypothetical protein BHM03_00056617 [Ensete ventricosum]